jgi:hypothetical protein
VQGSLQRLKDKEIIERNMLFISRDIEQSILEKHYGEIVRSNNVEFQSLMNEILSDTLAHREFLNDKTNENEAFKEEHPTASRIR